MSSYTYSMNEVIDQFFLADQDAMLVTSKGSTIYQIVPFDSHVPVDNVTAIGELDGIATAIPIIFKQLENTSSSSFFTDAIIGVDMFYLKFYLWTLDLIAGSVPKENSNEILIGSQVLGGNLNVGDEVNVGGMNLTVSGIMTAQNVLFDHFIFTDIDLLQEAYDLKGYCTMAFCLPNTGFLDNITKFTETQNEIEDLNPNLQLISPDSLKESAGRFFDGVNKIQMYLSLVPFVLSIIYVFTLMMINVRDRSREFGALKAIGASQKQIFYSIFFQTMFLILLSLAIGIIVGFIFFSVSYSQMNQLNFGFNTTLEFAKEMIRTIPASVYGNAVIGTLTSGLIVSIVPAMKASKTSIVQGFRRDV